jgi:hypothetical protein
LNQLARVLKQARLSGNVANSKDASMECRQTGKGMVLGHRLHLDVRIFHHQAPNVGIGIGRLSGDLADVGGDIVQ